jgi:3-oxoacyl-[acyl-carrier protein] reductase
MKEDKKSILILGASSDIGLKLVKEILNDYDLILAHCYKNVKSLESLQNTAGTKIIPIAADLSLENGPLELVAEVRKYCEFPEKIVHMPAPKFSYTRFHDCEWRNFQEEIDLQVRSAVIILRQFLPLMAKNKSGKIVFMLSSVTAGNPPKALSPYVLGKYALLGLAKALAVEYAEKNVQINSVSPSMVETKFLSNIAEKFVEISAANSPLRRNATTSDIVPMVRFLLSSGSDYMTGQNIYITGGS